MRGSPILHLLVFAAAFAVIAWKVADYTGAGASGATRAGEQADASEHHDDGMQVVEGADEHPEEEHVHIKVPAHIRVHFAHPPKSASLEQEDTELIPSDIDWTESPVEFEAKIEVSHEGNEMFLAAEWPEGTPDTALTVEIEPDGLDTRSQTVWTDESELDEVILFEW